MAKLTTKQRADIFWKCVDVGTSETCWTWKKSLTTHGYGAASLKGKHLNASRLAWILSYGDPGNLVVCHKCDNRACCNPGHLFVASKAANIADCIKKGRGRGQFQKSLLHPRHAAKLDEKKVFISKELFAMGVPQTEIAKLFGVHSSSISRAISGNKWAHLK